MTTRTYKYGKYSCKAYKKACGKGWEVGFTFAGQQVFVGNFIHAKEANAWWGIMNHEVQKFGKKYVAASTASVTWTCKFMANCMYKAYYSYLDREFSKYHRGYSQAVKKDERRYSHIKKTYAHKDFPHYTFRKAA
jgi:hypothetical protein